MIVTTSVSVAALREIEQAIYDKMSSLDELYEVKLSGLATEEFVKQQILEATFGDKDVDLSNYYTKSEVDTIHNTNNLTVSYSDEIVTISIG